MSASGQQQSLNSLTLDRQLAAKSSHLESRWDRFGVMRCDRLVSFVLFHPGTWTEHYYATIDVDALVNVEIVR